MNAPDAEPTAEPTAERGTWLPFALAATLVVVALAVIGGVTLAQREDAPECARKVKASTPLDAPDRFTGDEHLETLAAAVTAMGAPFGPVLAGAGYSYDQWLHLYGVRGGLLAFTKNNAPVTMLDADSLAARWSLRPAAKRIAWDASEDRFALVGLSARPRVTVGSYDLRSGRERWCVELTTKHRDGQPVSTAFTDEGDLLIVLPVDGGLDVARLDGATGTVRWFTGLEDVGRADYLRQVDADSFLVGGVEGFRLAQGGEQSRPGFGVFALEDGGQRVQHDVAAGDGLHVVGLRDDLVVALVSRGGRTRLDGIGLDGTGRWTTPLPGATVDTTLRGDVVLARTADRLLAYRADTGRPAWSVPVPEGRTYFPYGFTLDQVPTLDADHVLLPTTEALVALDLRDGRRTAYPLPTDGVSTTYWPYQLVVTDDLLGVVTNTGGVVVRREP